MTEWVVEEGIGETRALLVQHDEILAARLSWLGELTAGQEVSAKLTSKTGGTQRGTATLENGVEVLVDQLPPDVTEGAEVDLLISRAPIAERGRFKRAHGRLNSGGRAVESSAKALRSNGRPVRRFPAGLWEDVWSAASSGSLEFPGGEVLVSVTPAMTVVDVDGEGSPLETSLAAIPAIARAIRWFDLGGNIGIDFPTIEAKADRKAVDEALAGALASWPHERTAMNGFGLVQLVARLEGPSLLHRFATSRTGMCARMALRRAEMTEGTGRTLLLTIHPAIKAKLKSEWLVELARRTGKEVRVETDPGLALEASQAQIVQQ